MNEEKNLLAKQSHGSARCTFEVIIRTTQNATWQGHIHWTDTNQKQSFRSVLEMLTLMDEALVQTIGDVEPINWS